MLLLYFGPETLLPAASVVAGAAGVALMFGRRVVAALRAGLSWLATPFRRSSTPPRNPRRTRGR